MPLHAEPFALLDDRDGVSRLFEGYRGALDCRDAGALPALFAQLQAAGCHAVGLFSYELGAQMHGIAPRADGAPWASVLLFERCRVLDSTAVDAWLAERTAGDPEAAPAGIGAVRANVDEATFSAAIARIRDYIAAGDTYQVNYTYRLHFSAYGRIEALYRRLRARQPVPYGALIALPDGRAVLSRSPELFVRHAGGELVAQPMKGTARATGDEAADAAAAQALAQDAKNRAENLMIVDLLRNDLGRIARTGSVTVPALFEVRRYADVLQMTSTIRACLRDGASLADVFAALYPCGSITGAPKRRTMQIVRELEPAARGLYTGAIGWFAPAAPDGVPDFCLSVPIRTLVLEPEAAGVRSGVLGVGAGIVHDSVAAEEFEECKLKARFLTGLAHDFELFETMRASAEEGVPLLEAHLARMGASAAWFGMPFDAAAARALVTTACADFPAGQPQRLRLALRDGRLTLQHAALTPLATPVRLLLAAEPMRSDDLFLRHKTSVRARYDAAWRAAEAQGAFDMIFVNERGELTEGGRSNLFVKLAGRWHTPPLSAGLLPGVMRAQLLRDWQAQETPLTLADLRRADAVVACNALRGALAAEVVWPPGAS